MPASEPKFIHMKLRNYLIALIFVGAVGVIDLLAQPPKNPDKGFQPGGGLAISDIETINTTNGNMILNIPIVSLPKGRSSITKGLSLVYNSKLYEQAVEELPDHSNQITPQHWLVPSHSAGWNYSHQMLSLDVRSRFQYEVTVQCGGWQANMMHAYVWKVGMHMPDGSFKEFRPAGYTDALDDGFFQITPNGWSEGGCSGSGGYVTTGPMTYYSTDGTYLKLVVEHAPNGHPRGYDSPWTLYYPDGSRIVGGVGVPQQHFDKNGNEVRVMTDEFGREIDMIAVSANEQHFVARGVSNSELLYKVKWKDISVNKSYETTGAGIGTTRGTTSTQTMQATFKVVEKITLPTQAGELTYEFGYNAASEGGTGWGELSYVKLPSGAEVTYNFVTPLLTTTTSVLKNFPATKTLTYLQEHDGQAVSVSETTSYSIWSSMSTVTTPDGGATTQHYESHTYNNRYAGLVYKEKYPGGGLTERIWAFNQVPWDGFSNSYVKTEFNTIPDASGNPSLTAIKDYTLDQNGNTVEVREYDWIAYNTIPRGGDGKPNAVPGSAVLKRRTITEYYNSPTGNSSNAYYSHSSPNYRQAVKAVEVRNSAGTIVSRTEYEYDSAATTANLTRTRVWDSTQGGLASPDGNGLRLNGGNSVSSQVTYNQYGMPLTTTDANNVTTQITYGNVSGPNGDVTDLYPTQTVAAYGTAVARTSSAVYDFYTGLVTSTTDEDNDLTTVTEYDDLGRPTKSRSAYLTPLEAWTVMQYDDINRRVIVKSDLETVGDGKKVAVQHFDQLGRVRLARRLENLWEDPTNEQHGIKVQTRYKAGGTCTFDSNKTCSFRISSNPYRAAISSIATNEPTMGWTMSESRAGGLYSETQTFSGSDVPAPFGGSNTSSTGIAKSTVDANATTVEDQAGKLRRSITNALGQMVRVDEPNGSNQLGTVSSPNQATSYAYDALNNLTTITQGGQTRTLAYSSLSRLLSATNPENGTIDYGYDPNGNLTNKTDARSISTAYTYDALNRVTFRNYSDSTPDDTYTYDNKAHAYGKLTKVSSSVSTTEYTTFDILGRVTGHKQTTDGNNYTTGYTYSLSGQILEQTYPSGRVVKNTFDASDGSLSQVQSRRSNETYRNFANGFVYNTAGSVTSMRLGNGLWESTTFNSRLQPTQIGLGSGSLSQNKLKLEYTYGTSQNNGNVLSQTITVPGIAHPFVQNYTYDSFNRITSAEETSNSIQTWKQAYVFDRYGNRTFDEAQTTTIEKNCGTSPNFAVCTPDIPVVNPTASTSNNRLNGTTYDAAGNVIEDAEGRQFSYDAENKQIGAENASSQVLGQYYFDGNGKRVKKVVPATGEITIFVYDFTGKLIGEYSTVVQPSQDAKTQYLTSDHLGTPRINTDATGQIVSRSDYMPYGEEIVGLGGRSGGQDYVVDDVRQMFTGYENDGETGLEHAQARMYRSSLARFTTTDPILMEPNRTIDPQRINLYVYVRNNPLALTDRTGEIIDDSSLADDEKYQKWKAKFLSTEAGRALWDKYHNNKDFNLVIKNDPGRDNGALTSEYQFKDGKLVGATISLGSDIGDRSDAAARPDRYPLTKALGKEYVDTDLMGAAVLAHEFGHVEDAASRPEAFILRNEYDALIKDKTAALGTISLAAADPDVAAKRKSVFAAFGAKDWTEVENDNDLRAERTAIPVVQQSYGNAGKKIPKNIQKAIDGLQK